MRTFYSAVSTDAGHLHVAGGTVSLVRIGAIEFDPVLQAPTEDLLNHDTQSTR